jgi:hypothetical protein
MVGTFDEIHGTDTGGKVRLHELEISSPNTAYGSPYEATSVDIFPRAMSRISIDHSTFDFIDLGSGKGRVLLMASAYPFRRIIGIEFSQELHRIAERNVLLFKRDQRKCSQIITRHQDASEYEIAGQRLVLYLFDPFKEPVLAQILTRIKRLSMSLPEFKLIIIYYEARCDNLITQSGLTKYILKIDLDKGNNKERIHRPTLYIYSNFDCLVET